MSDEVPVSITEQRLRETEQRLREAFAAAAQTVTPTAIRLPNPAGRPERCWSRLPWARNRPRSWERRLQLPRLYEHVLIPLAAAAAVTVIATAMTMVVPKAFSAAQGSHRGIHQVGQGHAAARPAGVARAGELAAAFPRRHVPHGATPRYFVGIRQLSAPTTTSTAFATALAVYSAATGRVVASLVQPGRGRYYQAVTALGSDQTFVAAAIPARGPDCHTWFYRFSLGSQGQPTGWAPLAVPGVTGEVRFNNALAASGDGNVIAYSASACAQDFGSQVGVIHLGTKKVRTWSTLWPALPRTLSLSANGTLLSFVGNPSSGRNDNAQTADAVWTLHTDAAAGPVARHYRKVLHTPGGVQSAVLSPTGTIVFAMTASNPQSSVVSMPDVNAYDVATGKLLGLVQTVRYASDQPGFSPDTSGQYVLVYPGGMPFVQELNLVTRRLVTVSVRTVPVAVAW
jgi:hypothetical protein